MLKVLGYLIKGFLYGTGLTAGIVGVILLVDYFELFPDSGLAIDSRQKQTDYLKNMLSAIGSVEKDYCDTLPGVWVGSSIENDGASITKWEVTYQPDGSFSGVHTTKTITEESVVNQTGTWECSKSVLFTDIIENGRRYQWNYLIFFNDKNERVYAHIGEYGLMPIFRSYRRVKEPGI